MSRVFNLNRYDKIVANDLSLNGTFSTALGGIWQSSNSDIYYNGGNVGIGTTNPDTPLHVIGHQDITNPNASNLSNCMAKFDVLSTGAGVVLGSINDNTPYIGDCNGSASNSTGLLFLTQSQTRMKIGSNGNVGIGTSSPVNKLEISGGAIQLSPYASGSTNFAMYSEGDVFHLNTRNSTGGYNGIVGLTMYSNGNVGIGTTSPGATLEVAAPLDTGTSLFESSSIMLARIDSGYNVAMGSIVGYHKAGANNSSSSWAGGLLFRYKPMNNQGNKVLNDGMVLNALGNVGIGTTDPESKLHIKNGPICIERDFGDSGDLEPGLVFLEDHSSNDSMYIAYDAGGTAETESEGLGFYSKAGGGANPTGGTQIMMLRGSGNVGIGTTSPTAQLQIHEDSTSKNTQLKFSHSTTGTGNASDGFDLVLERTSNDMYLIQRESADIFFRTSNTNRMIINSSGRVGIGTSSPGYPLHVDGYVLNSKQDTRRFRRANGLAHSSNLQQNTSIYARYAIGSSDWIYAISDRRIKTNIVEINDETALNKIRLLKPSIYTYRDTYSKGTEEVIGFIAQEVLDAIPQAVKTQPGYIPNVLIMGSCIHDSSNNYIITIPDYDTSTLEVDSSGNIFPTLQISIDNEKGDIEIDVNILEVISKTELKVELNTNNEGISELPNEIFIYGQFIEEKYTLIKDRIFSTGISALQEVDRQLQAEKAKVATLESQLADVLSRLAALENA